MPDLLTHVFLAYAVVRSLSWRIEWLDRRYVTVALVGAFIPDLIKVGLIVNSRLVERLVGVPFAWQPLHTIGGVIIAVLIGGLLASPSERKRVTELLSLGAVIHLVADGLLMTPTGRMNAVFWPFWRYHPPTPGIYMSTDPVPTVITGTIALAVFALTRRIRTSCTSEV